ncbi:hypothetical protein H0H93_006120 [Arthromyces matolae]|nr:hypothetical protein H0H93_006120 [Arthromyces matolae]
MPNDVVVATNSSASVSDSSTSNSGSSNPVPARPDDRDETVSLGSEEPDSAGDHPMSEPTDSGSSVDPNRYHTLERYFEEGAPPLIASAANGTE